jgi:hypothetical protein
MVKTPTQAVMQKRRAAGKKLIAQKPTKPKGKNGGARPGAGRPKGRMNEKTISLHEAYERAFFGKMSEEERAQLDPADVFEIMMRCALEARSWEEAKVSAERWAPYRNARLAPKPHPAQPITPPPDGMDHVVVETIEIVGGAPKRRAFERELGRGDDEGGEVE